MNEKQLNQIEELLSGQKRYKLLDCGRKDILRLKGARLQVWLAQYMSESDDQQSWLSLEQIMLYTGLAKHTVIEARRWLVANGWMRELDGSAADKYKNPTQGAHKVRIYCVDDPTNGGAEIAPPVSKTRGVQKLHVQELHVQELGAEIAPNVSSSVSVSSFSLLPSVVLPYDTTQQVMTPSGAPSLREDEKQKQNQQQKQKQKPMRSSSAVKWLETYDSSRPVEFDTWSQVKRTEWCEAHKLEHRLGEATAQPVPPCVTTSPCAETVIVSVEAKREEPAPVELKPEKPVPVIKPPIAPPPPAPKPKPWEDDKPVRGPSPFCCGFCDVEIASKKEFAEHQLAAHGYKQPSYFTAI